MNTASYGLELFFALSIWGEVHTEGIDTRLECHDSGASPGFGRGSQEFFFSDMEICMSRSDMLRMAKPYALC